MTARFDAFKAEVAAHLDGMPLKDWPLKHPGTHLWATYRNYQTCACCGIVRRADGQNRPCRGIVRISLREGS